MHFALRFELLLLLSLLKSEAIDYASLYPLVMLPWATFFQSYQTAAQEVLRDPSCCLEDMLVSLPCPSSAGWMDWEGYYRLQGRWISCRILCSECDPRLHYLLSSCPGTLLLCPQCSSRPFLLNRWLCLVMGQLPTLFAFCLIEN